MLAQVKKERGELLERLEEKNNKILQLESSSSVPTATATKSNEREAEFQKEITRLQAELESAKLA